MSKPNFIFVPIITTAAGSCLTSDNWREVNVTAVSYSLESLLFKPGYALLKCIKDSGMDNGKEKEDLLPIKAYLGLSDTTSLIINAQSLVCNKTGMYVLKSPFDGSILKINKAELMELILQLKPEAVLLPKNITDFDPNIWSKWPDCIKPFIHKEALEQITVSQPHGIYFTNDCFNQVGAKTELTKWSHLPCYITADVLDGLQQKFDASQSIYLESNKPAHDALLGRVYSKSGEIDLTNALTEKQFEVIEKTCQCPTCTLQLTKAYLHHLYFHTPLLCYRFLIQHNIFHTHNGLVNEASMN